MTIVSRPGWEGVATPDELVFLRLCARMAV
jgi:hypothetical protein